MAELTTDVLVIGAGIAGLSAALTAREAGAEVTVLERAPYDDRGGNTRFSNGALRVAHNGLADIIRLVPDLSPAEQERTDFGTLTREEYLDDMARVTQYRADPDLAELLVDGSYEALLWLRGQGARYMPNYGFQAPAMDGKIRFWGGSALIASGGGAGILDALYAAAERKGVTVLYGTRAVALAESDAGITGASVRQGRRSFDIAAKAVVLAAGGFEGNAEWRTRHLGPGWDLAKVRGSRFNTGDGIRMALDAGAVACGHWSGCHSASWDANAPDAGDPSIPDNFKRDDYLYGIIVNTRGERFLDEGADLRHFTYAKYGRAILAQPGQTAWQVYDAQGLKFLHEEYRGRRAARFRADTLAGLADKMEGIDRAGFLATVAAYNAAIRRDVAFNPATRDGRSTVGLAVPKSNWATAIEEPPFEAYGVTCGITFTFGGIRIDNSCRVVDLEAQPIPGLYAAGTLVGGLFYFNYPGGSGLIAGAVFGRIAGAAAAAEAGAGGRWV